MPWYRNFIFGMVGHLSQVWMSRPLDQGQDHFGKMGFLDCWIPNSFAVTGLWHRPSRDQDHSRINLYVSGLISITKQEVCLKPNAFLFPCTSVTSTNTVTWSNNSVQNTLKLRFQLVYIWNIARFTAYWLRLKTLGIDSGYDPLERIYSP